MKTGIQNPIPLESEDKELGNLLEWYANLPREKRIRLGGLETVRVTKEVGRNDSCPCGSGKKFKKCCMK